MGLLNKLQHPITTFFLAASLLTMVLCLPQYDVTTQSTVARLLKPSSGAVQLAPQLPQPHVATWTGREWQYSNPDTESWDYATRVGSGEVKDAFVFTYTPPTRIESGFFGLTQSETIESLQTWPSLPGHSDVECRAVAL
jgi:hypothetical protein